MATTSLLSFYDNDRQYKERRNGKMFDQSFQSSFSSSQMTSSDSEDEDRIALQTHIARNMMLKQSFKTLISNILTHRKTTDLNESCIQVANDHKVFKVFKEWKRLKNQAISRMAEVQFLIDRKSFQKKRVIFKIWANLVINSKKADLHFLGKMFARMKDICAAELLTRLKKIELTILIQKKHIKKILQSLREHRQFSCNQIKKTDIYYKFRLKQKTFSSFAAITRSLKKDNLKYHQFKMAHLFHKHVLYRKFFNLLLLSLQNRKNNN